jgi:hypothetical protein
VESAVGGERFENEHIERTGWDAVEGLGHDIVYLC